MALISEAGFTRDDSLRVNSNAIQASWLPDDRKKELHQELSNNALPLLDQLRTYCYTNKIETPRFLVT